MTWVNAIIIVLLALNLIVLLKIAVYLGNIHEVLVYEIINDDGQDEQNGY